jgi:hypothetical protein
VQLVCGQSDVCPRNGGLSDSSEEQQLQHADIHVGSCHLQTEVH